MEKLTKYLFIGLISGGFALSSCALPSQCGGAKKHKGFLNYEPVEILEKRDYSPIKKLERKYYVQEKNYFENNLEKIV